MSSYTPFAPKTEKALYTQKLMGVYIDKNEAVYLHLNALYKNTSISEILRELIKEFINKNENKDYIITQIAEKAHETWKEYQSKNIGKIGWKGAEQIAMRWDNYKIIAISNLKKKKIFPEIIDKIIRLMEEMELKHD